MIFRELLEYFWKLQLNFILVTGASTFLETDQGAEDCDFGVRRARLSLELSADVDGEIWQREGAGQTME